MYQRRLPVLYLKLFRPGQKVLFNGRTVTVDSVHVRGYVLLVKLVEVDQAVDSDQLSVEAEPVDFNLATSRWT